MKLSSSVTVFKIASVDEQHYTITLNLLLSIIWKDTRLTLESNDPNEYVAMSTKIGSEQFTSEKFWVDRKFMMFEFPVITLCIIFI